MIGIRCAVIVAGGLALASCTENLSSNTTKPLASERTLTLLGNGEVVRHSSTNLTNKTREAYGRFAEKKGEPFGAMYVTRNGNTWGWTSDKFTLEDAKRSSKALCRIKAQSECVLYATISPVNTPQGAALPNSAADLLKQSTSGNIGYVGIAKNAVGNYSFSWNYNGQSVASRSSLRVCESSARKSRETDPQEVVKAYDAESLYTCQVFGVFN